jgi:hypothetical protein
LAFAAFTSRFLGGAMLTSESTSVAVTWAMSCTAFSKASWFAFDGFVVQATLGTNCGVAASISSASARCSKSWRVPMLRDMRS